LQSPSPLPYPPLSQYIFHPFSPRNQPLSLRLAPVFFSLSRFPTPLPPPPRFVVIPHWFLPSPFHNRSLLSFDCGEVYQPSLPPTNLIRWVSCFCNSVSGPSFLAFLFPKFLAMDLFVFFPCLEGTTTLVTPRLPFFSSRGVIVYFSRIPPALERYVVQHFPVRLSRFFLW